MNLLTTMDQLSALQVEKQVTEESLASQLAATKEELLTVKTTCEQLSKDLAIAQRKLCKNVVVGSIRGSAFSPATLD